MLRFVKKASPVEILNAPPKDSFPEKTIYDAWATGKRITYNGVSYRVGKMNYGDYFFEPGEPQGETQPFNRGTLWLGKVLVRNQWGKVNVYYEVSFEVEP